MQKISPMLWFDDQAEAAAKHYISVFSKRPGSNRGESSVLDVSRYREAGPGPAGTVMVVRFQLEGQAFTALNGGRQNFAFSEAISFIVNCETQEEVDHFWTALSQGGEEGPCGWLKDRYGLSWQVVPTGMETMLNDPDQEKAQRAMTAMLAMKKIDLSELQRAFDGESAEPKKVAASTLGRPPSRLGSGSRQGGAISEVDTHYDPPETRAADLDKSRGGEDTVASDMELAPGDLLPGPGDHRVALERAGAAFPREVDGGTGERTVDPAAAEGDAGDDQRTVAVKRWDALRNARQVAR